MLWAPRFRPRRLLCCPLLLGQFLHGGARYFVTECDTLVIRQHKLAVNVALEMGVEQERGNFSGCSVGSLL